MKNVFFTLCFILITTLPAQENGLVGFWTFDDSTANDQSGLNNHGNISGADLFIEGIKGTGVYFNGDGSYIQIPDTDVLDTDSSMTISLWIKPDSFGSGGSKFMGKWYSSPQQGDWLFSTSSRDSCDGRCLSWWIYFANYREFSQGVTSVGSNDTSNFLRMHQWNHIAVTFDTGFAKSYYNGNYIRCDTSEIKYTSLDEYNTDDIYIGRYWKHTKAYDFFGLLDEIRIYNRALTDNEILNIYTMDMKEDKLLAHYPCDGDAMDACGMDNHGVLYGPIPAANRFAEADGALYFDGADDYISIDSYHDMSPGESVSVSAWIQTMDSTNSRMMIYDRLETRDGFGLVINDSGCAYLSINGGSARCVGKSAVDDQKWHLITGTYSAQDSMLVMYIDGAPEDTTLFNKMIDYSPEPRNQIGRTRDGEDYFKGMLDDLRIYNYALSQQEVTELYDNYTGIKGRDNPDKIIFSLEQNYPNPFNSGTTISYFIYKDLENSSFLGSKQMVELTLYNVMGQKISTLVSDLQSPGQHTVSWNAIHYPSGIYYYHLSLNGKQGRTRKMLLLK